VPIDKEDLHPRTDLPAQAQGPQIDIADGHAGAVILLLRWGGVGTGQMLDRPCSVQRTDLLP